MDKTLCDPIYSNPRTSVSPLNMVYWGIPAKVCLKLSQPQCWTVRVGPPQLRRYRPKLQKDKSRGDSEENLTPRDPTS